MSTALTRAKVYTMAPDPVVVRQDDRFIPARAGNGLDDTRTFPEESVHPRACGERVFHGHRNAGFLCSLS